MCEAISNYIPGAYTKNPRRGIVANRRHPPHAECEFFLGDWYSPIFKEIADKFDKIDDVTQRDTIYDSGWGGTDGWGTYADDILDSPEKLSPNDFEVLLSPYLADLLDERKDYVR